MSCRATVRPATPETSADGAPSFGGGSESDPNEGRDHDSHRIGDGAVAPLLLRTNSPELDRVRALDPLALDQFLGHAAPPLDTRPLEAVRAELSRATLVARTRSAGRSGHSWGWAAALAALRDLDFLLCAWERREPGGWRAVTGLEPLLVELGSAAGHIPRGSVLTYGPGNPTDPARMRTFTGLPEEGEFVRSLQTGMAALNELLQRLLVCAEHPAGTQPCCRAAMALVADWEPMVAASVAMHRRMPPEIFSLRIIPYFLPLTIAGTRWQGVTGAQTQNCAIDWVMWGVDCSDSAYRAYAAANLDELLPAEKDLVRRILVATNGCSLLTKLAHDLTMESGADAPTGCQLDDAVRAVAVDTLDGVAALLRRTGSFRRSHRRLAAANLPLRPTPTGSGGHTINLLDLLIDHTDEARARVREMQAQLAGAA